jgi:thiamine-phosphate pyrophosphorylase
MRGLYAIADLATLTARGLDPVAFAEAVLPARPVALQLRAKGAPPDRTLALLGELAPRCLRAGVPLVANDDPDLAVRAGCAMVHVGQGDLPVGEVRRRAPGLGVGVSTHDLAQLERALAARPRYVAFGPVFATTSKADASPVVGTRALRQAYALARAAGIPLVAIGGITLARAAALAPITDVVAVIGDLLPQGEGQAPAALIDAVRARACALRDAITRAS